MDKQNIDRAYFISFCIEQYKHAKGLTGEESMRELNRYGVLEYLEEHFEVLHTQSRQWLLADIEEFMDFQSQGDTLDIVFSFPPEKLKKKMPQGKIPSYFNLQAEPLELRLPESVEYLKGEVFDAVELQDLQRDSLAIDFSDGPATVFVQNSHFRALSALSRQLCLNSGSVDHLYLNLDELYSFEVKTDSFRIDTEYLSGSKNVDFQADPQECRRILWNPLSEKAKLNLKMKNPSEILLRE